MLVIAKVNESISKVLEDKDGKEKKRTGDKFELLIWSRRIRKIKTLPFRFSLVLTICDFHFY